MLLARQSRPGLQHLHDRLVVGDQRDQVVVGEVHGVAVEQRRDVILAVLAHLEHPGVDVARARHGDALAVRDELGASIGVSVSIATSTFVPSTARMSLPGSSVDGSSLVQFG